VDNYRCLVNFECKLGAEHLILGPNGAGKSTLFDVLILIRDFCAIGLPAEDRFVAATRTRWQDVDVQQFELDVQSAQGTYTFKLVVDSWGNPIRPRIVEESVTVDGKPIFRFTNGEVHLYNDRHEDKVQYPSDWHRSALATITERKENTKLSWFKRMIPRRRGCRRPSWSFGAGNVTDRVAGMLRLGSGPCSVSPLVKMSPAKAGMNRRKTRSGQEQKPFLSGRAKTGPLGRTVCLR